MVLQNARHIGGDEQQRASAHSTVRVRSACNDVHLDGVAALRAGLATGLLDPASRVWFSENVAVMRSCLGRVSHQLLMHAPQKLCMQGNAVTHLQSQHHKRSWVT